MSAPLQVNRIEINGVAYKPFSNKGIHLAYLLNVNHVDSVDVKLRYGYDYRHDKDFILINSLGVLEDVIIFNKNNKLSPMNVYILQTPDDTIPDSWKRCLDAEEHLFRRSLFIMVSSTAKGLFNKPAEAVTLEKKATVSQNYSLPLSFMYSIIAILCSLTCSALITMNFYSKLSLKMMLILMSLAFVGEIVYSLIFVNNRGLSKPLQAVFVCLVIASPIIEASLMQVTYWKARNGQPLQWWDVYFVIYFFLLFIQSFAVIEKAVVSYKGQTMVFLASDTKDHYFQTKIETLYGENVTVCTWRIRLGHTSFFFLPYALMALFFRIVQIFRSDRSLNDHGHCYFSSLRSFLANKAPLSPYVYVVRRLHGKEAEHEPTI